jgi:NAD(P)-dependent dehydrogenase (short-subunit alcohol dehydrogenase family)
MTPEPDATRPQHQGSGKLAGKVALITGGDSGIGRAVAVLFAREGADVAIGHLAEEDTDATETVKLVEAEGRRCLTLPRDVGEEAFCRQAVERTLRELGRLDVLVNNAAEQHTTQSISEISAEQLERTFRTNIFAMFYQGRPAASGRGLGDREHHLGHRLPGQPEPARLLLDQGRHRGLHPQPVPAADRRRDPGQQPQGALACLHPAAAVNVPCWRCGRRRAVPVVERTKGVFGPQLSLGAVVSLDSGQPVQRRE